MPAALLPPPARTDAARCQCVFDHPLFSKLSDDALFRPAETDGAPCLIIPLGRGTAALPLRSLQAELKIEAVSQDGKMLSLVARSLDFVADVRLGDTLPVEVLDGGASWSPSALHQQLAASRLKLQLIAELCGSDEPWAIAEPQAVLAAASDPSLRIRMHTACVAAAGVLGLPDAAAASRLVEDLAHESAFIEALRDRLLRRVQRLMDRVTHLNGGLSQNLAGLELVGRVRRLTGIALGKIGARFADLQAQTVLVLEAMRGLEARRRVIRQHRDWLYSSLRAWEPILAVWEASGIDWSDGTWPLLGRTYRFLAPRFMPVQEWQLATRSHRENGRQPPRMVW